MSPSLPERPGVRKVLFMSNRLIIAAIALVALPSLLVAQPAPAQSEPTRATVCGQQVAEPSNLPPVESEPVVWLKALCFEAQGNVALIDPSTYLYYTQVQQSTPTQGTWIPWTEETERTALEDFGRLWSTNFLDNLSIDVQDYTFSNGVTGKIVTYEMEERERVKIIDYVGSDKLTTADIYTKLDELEATIRADTFIDTAKVQHVELILREMLKAKGHQNATVTHELTPMAGGPKLVTLTFHMDEGPKVKIDEIVFEGNRAASDGELRGQMKENRETWFFSFIGGRGIYKEGLFGADAERVLDWYRDRGYIYAQVGDPAVEVIRDSSDGDTRWIRLRIPVVEGERYRVGDFTFDGNTVVTSEILRPMFDIKEGDWYSQKEIREGYEAVQKLYGAGGYWQFSGYPDNRPRDAANPADPEVPAALAAVESDEPASPPTVDVTLRLQEGEQFYVNRITFVGNTTTRDNVIRREMRMYENGIFNTDALDFSVRRINQLGYFQPLEGPGRDVTVAATPGTDDKVDVQFKLAEQNRNQITFGAGVSQFEGFFGQLSFQTANFLGRGESLTVSLQSGSRAQNYQLSFTEPFLFDRNITGGLNLYRQDLQYIGQFTQKSTGGGLTFGFPLGRGFTRMFTNYSYEQTRVTEINAEFCNPEVLARNPFFRDALLLGGASCEGQTAIESTQVDPVTGQTFVVPVVEGAQTRVISKISPTIVHNTVDQPIFPTTGRRLTGKVDVAGIGGNTNFVKPTLEGLTYWRQNNRMSLGLRGQWEYIRGYGSTRELPIFERLFLGGEYSIRGFDIRSVGPTDCDPGEVLGLDCTGLVVGGNKSLLFNVEQTFTIAGPVRLILFYDAGQVQSGPQRQLDGTTTPGRNFNLRDFKTSTGAEVRFFMPVLNVPFRLIFAQNPQRSGVLDNSFRPQKAFQFRFAVGTTF